MSGCVKQKLLGSLSRIDVLGRPRITMVLDPTDDVLRSQPSSHDREISPLCIQPAGIDRFGRGVSGMFQ